MNKITRRGALPLLASPAFAAPAATELEVQFAKLSQGFPGRLGIAVEANGKIYQNRGLERFSIQSVMKLFVGFAICELVDQGRLRLDTPQVFRTEDKSVFMQPIAKKLLKGEYKTSIAELIRYGIIDSDSAAADYLILHHLGKATEITKALERKGIRGLRVDRTERDLQTEVHGLRWKSEYLDEAVFERELANQPKEAVTKAYTFYRNDPRDTSTPVASAQFLALLHSGKLLQPETTAFLLQALRDCATGVKRLKAGLPAGWELGHKTGTSSTWQGIAAATNDIGILYGPKGQKISVAVYVGDAKAPEAEREAAIAQVAKLVVKALA
ncbi:MAG: class A beta-lactamase [Bryobacter sp.]